MTMVDNNSVASSVEGQESNCEIVYTVDEGYPASYRSKDNALFISENPLLNCQTYTIGGIDTILAKDNPIEYLRAAQKTIRKNQILFDISAQWMPRFEKIFDDPTEYIIKYPYVNSTGSNMVMCLVKAHRLKW